MAFVSMGKGDWRPERVATLKAYIKKGDPVSDTDGRDVIIANTKENIQLIDDYLKGKSKQVPDLKIKASSRFIKLNKIGKSQIFGGQGTGGGATGETARAECLQCVYLQAMLDVGTKKPPEYFTPAVLKKYFKSTYLSESYTNIMKAKPEWFVSGYATAKYLIDNRLVKTGMTFHRGDQLMTKVYDLRKTAFQNSDVPVLTSDKWNPGDIWAFASDITSGAAIARLLDTTTIEVLNDSLVRAYKKKQIIGISLKQIPKNKRVTHGEYNFKPVTFGDLSPHKYTGANIKRREFWSWKAGELIYDGSSLADVRNASELTPPNIEIKLVGARGGKGGYGQMQYAHDKYLGVTLPDNGTIISIAKQIKEGTASQVNAFYKMAKALDKTVTRKEFDEGLEKATLGTIHSKYISVRILYELDQAAARQRNNWVKYMVNYAGSKTTFSSAYIKVMAA